jgi:hypothetical protein
MAYLAPSVATREEKGDGVDFSLILISDSLCVRRNLAHALTWFKTRTFRDVV